MIALRQRTLRCARSHLTTSITPRLVATPFSTSAAVRKPDQEPVTSSASSGIAPQVSYVQPTARVHPRDLPLEAFEQPEPETDARLPKSIQAIYHEPLRRQAKYGIPVCDIQFRSFSVRNLEFMCDFAMRAAYYAKLPAKGPVPLPKKVERWTVPRSNFVHKKSQENFERVTHKRLIQIQDGHPETVELWLAFLRQHQYYGVGMKANIFKREPLNTLDNLAHEDLPRDVKRPSWAYQGPPPKDQATAAKVKEILESPEYAKLNPEAASDGATEGATAPATEATPKKAETKITPPEQPPTGYSTVPELKPVIEAVTERAKTNRERIREAAARAQQRAIRRADAALKRGKGLPKAEHVIPAAKTAASEAAAEPAEEAEAEAEAASLEAEKPAEPVVDFVPPVVEAEAATETAPGTAEAAPEASPESAAAEAPAAEAEATDAAPEAAEAKPEPTEQAPEPTEVPLEAKAEETLKEEVHEALEVAEEVGEKKDEPVKEAVKEVKEEVKAAPAPLDFNTLITQILERNDLDSAQKAEMIKTLMAAGIMPK